MARLSPIRLSRLAPIAREEREAAGVPGRRSFKKGVISALAYLIAHESQHRGSIVLTLKQCGHALAKADRYAIWNWDRM